MFQQVNRRMDRSRRAKVAARGFRLQHGGQGLRTVANTGRSRSGKTTVRPGGKLAMGQALTIEVRHEQGYAIVTAAGRSTFPP